MIPSPEPRNDALATAFRDAGLSGRPPESNNAPEHLEREPIQAKGAPRLSTMALEAIADLKRGWHRVPIPPRQKGPRHDGWQALRLKAEEIPSQFPEGCNSGILTGAASGNLVDLDLDCAGAV